MKAAAAFLIAAAALWGQQSESKFPSNRTLTYRVEWGVISAGTVNIGFKQASPSVWNISVDVESAGVVNSFHRINDKYTVTANDKFCPASTVLDAQEGKKHKITRMNFAPALKSVHREEQDLILNKTEDQSLTVPPCSHDVASGLALLGMANVAVGHAIAIPMTDGKKFANVRVEAQALEKIVIDGKTYSTIRYQAFIFDNVIYRRKGRVFLWITDDADRVPVQFRLSFGFPVGNLSLELEKRQ